jgi:DUF1680 family protein
MAVLDPLAAGRDELPGKHANTQVPKVIGAAVTYEVTGDPDGRKIAENFWNIVTSKYTFAPGGNSDHEHFFPERDVARHLGPESAETCNVYNMLKLTEHLFEWKPERPTATITSARSTTRSSPRRSRSTGCSPTSSR